MQIAAARPQAVNMFHDGVLPKREVLPECAHRKFRLLFVLEKGVNYHKGREVSCSYRSAFLHLQGCAAVNSK